MRILLISRHFLNGTSEGLCAARTAAMLARAGHDLVAVTGPASAASESASTDAIEGMESIDLRRVEARPTAFEDRWEGVNRNASRSPIHRLVSAGLNLRHHANAEQWAWIRTATAAAKSAIRTAETEGRPFDVMHSRLSPPLSHQVAMEIVTSRSEARRLPWCASFSDPWPEFLYPAPFHSSVGAISRRRGMALLRSFLRHADSVVFPSDRLARYMAPYLEAAGEAGESNEVVGEGKVWVVPHAGPLAVGAEAARGSNLRIRHAGFLMMERRIEALLEAVGSLPEAMRAEIRLEFMGRNSHHASLLPRELEDCVSFLPPSGHRQASRWMEEADVQLLIESDFEEGIFMPSKLADYARSGKPILAMSPDIGVIADVLGSDCLRVRPSSSDQIASALRRLHRAWKDETLVQYTPGIEVRDRFDPRNTAPQFERALGAAVARSSASQ